MIDAKTSALPDRLNGMTLLHCSSPIQPLLPDQAFDEPLIYSTHRPGDIQARDVVAPVSRRQNGAPHRGIVAVGGMVQKQAFIMARPNGPLPTSQTA
jgi:hypothetical protein